MIQQIATTIEQSYCLIEMLKIPIKTADMYYSLALNLNTGQHSCSYFEYKQAKNKNRKTKCNLLVNTSKRTNLCFNEIPAWSLNALIDLCPQAINYDIKESDYFDECQSTLISNNKIIGHFGLIRRGNNWFCGYYTLFGKPCIEMNSSDVFDAIIKLIEWLFNNYSESYKNYLNK
jgi:hypothetical protein